MSKIETVRRCYSCGAILQTKNHRREGFIDKKALAHSKTGQVLLCDKCYLQTMRPPEPEEVNVDPAFLTMLRDANATEALIVFFVDLFSFECSFNKQVVESISRLPILVIANKRDLLPKEASDDDLKDYVTSVFRTNGLIIEREDVILASLTSMSDLSESLEAIKERRRRHDVYIIGAQQTGKSMFFTAFLRGYNNRSMRPIAYKEYPGTHFQVIQIPLDSSSYMYDTPGTGINNSFLGKADLDLVNMLLPVSPMEGREAVLEPGCALLFGGLAKIELLKSSTKRVPIKAYASPAITIKRLTPEMDNETHIRMLAEKKIIYPQYSGSREFADFDIYDITIDETGPRDLGIAGLGWITFEGAGQSFRLFVPKGIASYTAARNVR